VTCFFRHRHLRFFFVCGHQWFRSPYVLSTGQYYYVYPTLSLEHLLPNMFDLLWCYGSMLISNMSTKFSSTVTMSTSYMSTVKMLTINWMSPFSSISPPHWAGLWHFLVKSCTFKKWGNILLGVHSREAADRQRGRSVRSCRHHTLQFTSV
jgi:hypothetical protein